MSNEYVSSFCLEMSLLLHAGIGIEDGLYLLIQTEPMDGFYSFRPFLVTLPMDDSRSIQVSPLIQPIPSDEPPPTGQHPAPIFAAMALVVSGLGLAFCLDKLRKK